MMKEIKYENLYHFIMAVVSWAYNFKDAKKFMYESASFEICESELEMIQYFYCYYSDEIFIRIEDEFDEDEDDYDKDSKLTDFYYYKLINNEE
jgi:hypothetical protein